MRICMRCSFDENFISMTERQRKRNRCLFLHFLIFFILYKKQKMKEEHGMDSSRMNRGCCGANNMQNRRAASNNMELKMEPRNFPRKMQHVDHMIPAMAYVPMQRFEQIYDLSAALKNGTLFPELCKPFCGKGGGQCL